MHSPFVFQRVGTASFIAYKHYIVRFHAELDAATARAVSVLDSFGVSTMSVRML